MKDKRKTFVSALPFLFFSGDRDGFETLGMETGPRQLNLFVLSGILDVNLNY